MKKSFTNISLESVQSEKIMKDLSRISGYNYLISVINENIFA